ncbi:acyl-CoA dehydrogenase family protein [Pseudonocardia acaciae]|uniref:acyl-CoA dehydrogenase family protein n=1 Tax=Pseudonocardia acaciae TaxID=551276 RepID=UPI000684285C|nr:acyl-CoA dehydrogenase family protein [Pseudonocardia acaciae]
MSRNLPSGDVGSVYLRGLGPSDPTPGDIGVVVGRDGSTRERLEGLLAAARELRPRLLAEQAETEERGAYSPEMHRAFVEAGFFRVLLPKALGGFELGAEAFYQVIAEVARGCPSSAWCLCLAAGHTLTLASYWPERAQREIFGEHGYLVSPASFNGQPDVVITREERGLRVSGTWKYCSGAPYSTHFMPSFVLPPAGGGEPSIHWVVVPRSSYTVLDDWGGIIGMRGSGSHSIRVDDAFVPEHHVVEATWSSSVSGETAGSRLYGNPTYGGPFTAFAEGEIAAIVAGMGLAAVDEYERIITTSSAPWSGGAVRRGEHPVWQGKFGTALALVDSAVALSARGGQLYEELARRSVAGLEPFTAEKALRLNNLFLVAENQVWEAIEMMLRSAGSRHSADGARLQRYFRDMLATRTRTDQLDLFAVTTTQAHLGG